MKTKHVLLVFGMLMLTTLTTIAQDVTKKPNSIKDNIPFGKKLPPPDLMKSPGQLFPQTIHSNINTAVKQGIKHHDINEIKKALDDYRQQLKDKRIEQTFHFPPVVADANQSRGRIHNSDFHLTKDINALAESNPSNFSDLYAYPSYAILQQVIYFAADDGVHGSELWRSDGTAAGTFMVKDIEPGTATSYLYNITAANGKIYFSANTSAYGREPWVSDGTESGTQILMDINPGAAESDPTEFVELHKKAYFVSSVNSYLDGLWQTDGTTAGTKLVKSVGIDPGDLLISQLVTANGLLFFTVINSTSGAWELWRSDGTDNGTYHIGTNVVFYDVPLQLTNYNNKLYFSSTDGTGYKLWATDGTDAGTTLVPGGNDILVAVDGNFGITFPVLDNVLYIPGSSPTGVSGLYKYDASNINGVTLVKDLATAPGSDFISSIDMKVVNNTLYFKVSNSNGGLHDELWSSKGMKASTQLINKFQPGETINDLYSGNGTLYFVKYDKFLGAELWKILNTPFGTFPVPESDIFRGATSSNPNYLTAFKGKLFFSATDELKGNELYVTHGIGFGATVVKDINTVSTSSSYAGYYVNAMTPLGSNVVFTASEKVYGNELYGSDGTSQKTLLLNDIIPGETGSAPYNLISKNNAVYFIASTSDSTFSIFKTNGTKQGLQKVVPDYNTSSQYFILDFKVADNNFVFYVLYSYNTGSYQLWRSDGTAAGTLLLSPTISGSHYLNIVGNTAFFVGGDAVNGYELWKSDGSVAGTGIVKDINPGTGNSSPKGMVIYKNEVYFAADNAAGPSFWKSDGTNAGTIQLGQIDPWYASTVSGTESYYFEVSNNILYFSAIDYANSKGTQVWKTDGTVAGTQAVKDVSPDANSFYPVSGYFKDVNGTLFFIGDDGVHGTELWKSDGTETGTQMVKDITPGADASTLSNLISIGGKLFFTNSGILWSSDGTPGGTVQVDDPVISNVIISNIVAAGDKLFLSGYTYQYGIELYEGKVNNHTGKFVTSELANEEEVKISMAFNAVLYPNPTISNATLQITGSAKNISISITDMSGRKLWQTRSNNAMFVNLPTEKFAAGTYLVTITGDKGSKIIKLVKH